MAPARHHASEGGPDAGDAAHAAFAASPDRRPVFAAGRVGAALVGADKTAGVMFTGSTEVARLIQAQLAALAGAQGGAQHTVQAVHRGRSPGGRGYTRTVYALPADTAGTVVAEHWLLHHTGHAWAGGHASGSHTDPAAVDATAEMLRLFLAHRLPRH